MPGFQSFFRFFASFCIGQISRKQLKGQFSGQEHSAFSAKQSHLEGHHPVLHTLSTYLCKALYVLYKRILLISSVCVGGGGGGGGVGAFTIRVCEMLK